MIQEFIVGLISLSAVAYLVRMAYRSFQSSKEGCDTNCKCDSAKTINPLRNKT